MAFIHSISSPLPPFSSLTLDHSSGLTAMTEDVVLRTLPVTQMHCLQRKLVAISEIPNSRNPSFLCTQSYLCSANEYNPYLVKGHLERMKEGWILSVGGLRSLFNLILAPQDKCRGLCISDIDPEIVLAQRGFVLLHLLSKDLKEAHQLCQEFETLCSTSEKVEVEDQNKQASLLNRIQALRILQAQKTYYSQNLARLIPPLLLLLKTQRKNDPEVYQLESDISSQRAKPEIEPLLFMHNEASFQRLRQYAQQGQILAIYGNIYWVELPEEIAISVIDESNCLQYLPSEEVITINGICLLPIISAIFQSQCFLSQQKAQMLEVQPIYQLNTPILTSSIYLEKIHNKKQGL